jgi:hypothetical protein
MMIQERNNFFWYKLNAILRIIIVRGGKTVFKNHITINEYPKSGGSWISQMVAEATDLPFPRNRLPLFRACIMQGHYYRTTGIHNPLIVWRDGRDVIVSQYYHWLFGNEILGNKYSNKLRKKLVFQNYDNIHENLPAFIHYVNVDLWKKQPHFSWANFVSCWINQQAVFVKYEDIRQHPVEELQRIALELTGIDLSGKRAAEIIDKYSFQKQTGRKPGEEKKGSFVRKGIVGDWKNHFSDEAKNVFKQYAGNELIQLAYEKDLNW